MRRRIFGSLAAFVWLLHHAPTHAQLRPLDPAPWRAFDNSNFMVEAGVGVIAGQHATLAGTRGRLDELGLYGITWRTGRVALKASGVAFMRMSNETRIRAAHPGVGDDHRDAGTVVIETAARLTPDNASALMLLRFGSRLPITSLASGLDRDATDFFALLGLRSRGDVWFAAEAGAALHGRPQPGRGQTDVFIYTAGAGYAREGIPLAIDAWVVGHNDLHSSVARGNEDLVELRVGARTRGRMWAGAQFVRGLHDFSPSHGIRVSAGFDADIRRVPILGWK